MARKLFDPDLEKLVLKVALSSTKNMRLLAKLKQDHFASEAAGEAFERVSRVLSSRGRTISWRSLCRDAVLSDRTRAALQNFKTKAPEEADDIADMMESLQSYALVRRVNAFGKALAERMHDDEIDPKTLLSFVHDSVANIDTVTTTLRARHLGVGDNMSTMIKKLLKGDKSRHIATGFRGFDDPNKGIEIGSLLIVAAPSGNGKSVMVQTLARNFAASGARVCMVPLEMDDSALMRRELAAQTQIDLTRFIDPMRSMSRREREQAYKAYRKLSRRIKNAGGKLTFLSALEDLTIDNILAYSKSHNYNVVVIDYVGLLAGTDGDDQALALSRIARTAKMWATANKAVVVLAAQLSDDGVIRYSRALKEHASNLWQWMFDGRARELGLITVQQPKARMNSDAPFTLRFDAPTMTMRDPTEGEKKAARSSAAGEEKSGGPGAHGRGKGNRQGGGKPAKAKPIEAYLTEL